MGAIRRAISMPALGLVALIIAMMTLEWCQSAAAGGEPRTIEGTWKMRGRKGDWIFEGQVTAGAGRGFSGGLFNIEFVFEPRNSSDVVRFRADTAAAAIPSQCEAKVLEPNALIDGASTSHFVFPDAEAVMRAEQRAVAAEVAWETQRGRIIGARGGVRVRGNGLGLVWNSNVDFAITRVVNVTCDLGSNAPHTLRGERVSPSAFSFLIRPSHPSLMLVDKNGMMHRSFTAIGARRSAASQPRAGRAEPTELIADLDEFEVRHVGLNLTLALTNDLFALPLTASTTERAAFARALLARMRCAPLPCLHRQVPEVLSGGIDVPLERRRIAADVWAFASGHRPVAADASVLEPILREEDVHLDHNTRRRIRLFVDPQTLRRRGFDLKSAAELRAMHHSIEGNVSEVEAIALAIEQRGYRIYMTQAPADEDEEGGGGVALTLKSPHVLVGGGKGDAAAVVLRPTERLPPKLRLSIPREDGTWDALPHDEPLVLTEGCLRGRNVSATCPTFMVITISQQSLPGHEFAFRRTTLKDIANETFSLLFDEDPEEERPGAVPFAAAARFFRTGFVDPIAVRSRDPAILEIGIVRRDPLPFDVFAPITVSVQPPATALYLLDEPWRQPTRLVIVPSPGHMVVSQASDAAGRREPAALTVVAGAADAVQIQLTIHGETLAPAAARSDLANLLHPFSSTHSNAAMAALPTALAERARRCLEVRVDDQTATRQPAGGFSVVALVRSTCDGEVIGALRSALPRQDSASEGPNLPVALSEDGSVTLQLVPSATALRSGLPIGTVQGPRMVLSTSERGADEGEL